MRFTKQFLYRILLCQAVLTIVATNSVAQQKPVNIKGIVQDSVKAKALPFATVGLYRINDQQKALKNVFTDNKGRFEFTKVDTGHYVIYASNSGFQARQSAEIRISGNEQVVEIPALMLVTAAQDLAAVTVSARLPLIEQTDEKLTYNAEADPSVMGQNAIDVLRKTPFLSVDGDGNVQLNGQSNFRVLLDGKETAMFSKNLKDALQSFPANLIKKVEVITSPSSKYDGEGVAGIINIITKKKIMGYNGNISLSRNTLGGTNANANANFKYGKIGFTGYYGMNMNKGFKMRNASETESFNPVAFYKRVSTGERVNDNFYNYGNAELSVDLDSLNTISTYANLNGGTFENTNRRFFDLISPDKTDTSRSLFTDNGSFSYPSVNWGLDFIRKFKRLPEQELTFKMYHEYNRDNNLIESDQHHPGNSRFIINDNNSTNRQSTWQLDYVHPLKNKTKLEGGLKAVLRRATANYESLVSYNQEEKYLLDSLNSDNFKYHQNVYSAYLTYRFTIKKYSFRIGSRIEQTDVKGDFIKSSTRVRQDYTTFMPSLFVSRKFAAIHTLSFSYNKRLTRPYIWDLNPFVNNTDSLNLYFGNPNLDAELYHAFELAYTVFKGKTNINVRLTESFSNTQITRYSFFDENTGITSWTSDNIGSYSSTGLSGNISFSLTSKWRLNSNLGLRYDFVKNTQNDSQKNQGLGGYVNLNSNYDINTKFSISASGNIWKAPVQLQGRYGSNYFYGVGGNYKFLKKKLTLSLNANNLFQKYVVWKSFFKDNNFQTQSWNYRPARSVNVSIRWNFGKLTENVSRKRGVSNDDLKARE
jgi:outer membrane receptor protein involved in Fe transport